MLSKRNRATGEPGTEQRDIRKASPAITTRCRISRIGIAWIPAQRSIRLRKTSQHNRNLHGQQLTHSLDNCFAGRRINRLNRSLQNQARNSKQLPPWKMRPCDAAMAERMDSSIRSCTVCAKQKSTQRINHRELLTGHFRKGNLASNLKSPPSRNRKTRNTRTQLVEPYLHGI